MAWITILAFAISSSIDNLGVGMSYGIQKVHIQMKQNILIAVICFLFSMSGIYLGIWIYKMIPGIFPVMLGAILLFIIGIRVVLLAKAQESQSTQVEKNDLKELLRNPEFIRERKEKRLGWLESVVLGIALSANALTNGIGAGLIGLSPLAISITAAFGSFFSVWMGVKIGRKVADIRIGSFTIGQFGTLLSGVILLGIATVVIVKIYQ